MMKTMKEKINCLKITLLNIWRRRLRITTQLIRTPEKRNTVRKVFILYSKTFLIEDVFHVFVYIRISAHGTKKMKLEEIDEFTYAHFQKAREQLLSIHNIDLKRLALKKAREVHDDTFVAREH